MHGAAELRVLAVVAFLPRLGLQWGFCEVLTCLGSFRLVRNCSQPRPPPGPAEAHGTLVAEVRSTIVDLAWVHPGVAVQVEGLNKLECRIIILFIYYHI